ncbi:MAG: hypothetical protein EOM87_03330 [Clostridia bacterium]|nr:hypothetical protein [Clostridia bacterium]
MKMVIKKGEVFNIPNILTYVRLICVPAFVLVFFLVTKAAFLNIYISLAIFAFASLTDVVDGKIARKYNLTSDLGSMLDPLADKLLQVSVIICLTIGGNLHWIFPALIGAKELYMIIGGILLANKNIVGKANFFGKAAAFVFAIAILMSFFGGSVGVVAQSGGANAGKIYDIVIYCVFAIGLAFSYTAAAVYTRMVLKQIGGVKQFKDSKDIKINYSINQKDNTNDKHD